MRLRGQMLEGPLFDCDDNVTQATECEEGMLHRRDCLLKVQLVEREIKRKQE